MSSDSVGGTGAANSNQPRGVPQRRDGVGEEEGEINMKRKGKKETDTQCGKHKTHTRTHRRAGGRKRQRLRGEGGREGGQGRGEARAERHNGCGFHHAEGCWLPVWATGKPRVPWRLAAAMSRLLGRNLKGSHTGDTTTWVRRCV